MQGTGVYARRGLYVAIGGYGGGWRGGMAGGGPCMERHLRLEQLRVCGRHRLEPHTRSLHGTQI